MANLTIGESAVPFTLIGVDDELHSLVDYGDNTAVAVIFSCNHCPYAQAWEDRLIALQEEFEDRGIQFVMISPNDAEQYPEDSFEKMKERAAEKDYNFPYLYDEQQEVARAYGAERTPEVFLFDAVRTLHYHGTVDDNYEDPDAVEHHYLRDALESVVEGIRPPVDETEPVGCTIKWKPA